MPTRASNEIISSLELLKESFTLNRIPGVDIPSEGKMGDFLIEYPGCADVYYPQAVNLANRGRRIIEDIHPALQRLAGSIIRIHLSNEEIEFFGRQ